ncbi:MAG: hypothetical protein JW803_08175 [Endomicrobiales bacterium]|nr:hypothetical protein [Endomicrobiales bacterium]
MKNDIKTFLNTILSALGLYNTVKDIYRVNILNRFAKEGFEKTLDMLERTNKIGLKKNCGMSILHFYPELNYGFSLYINLFIDYMLKIRGANVEALICEGEMTFCTTCNDAREGRLTCYCKNCMRWGQRYLDLFKINVKKYREYITKDEIKGIEEETKKIIRVMYEYKYKGINVGYHAINSADRYFMGKKPIKNEYLDIYKEELRNAMISVKVAETIFKENKYDLVIMQHGIYASWGSFVEYAKNVGIKDRVYAFADFYDCGLVFDIFKAGSEYEKYLELRGNRELNEKEKKELNAFLSKRKKSLLGQIKLYKNVKNLPQGFMESLKSYKRVYMIFPNLTWDPGIENLNTIYSNIWEWISHTIELFKDKPEYKLILKPHPSDILSQESLEQKIKHKYADIKENITILPADVKLKAYDFFPHIHRGIVYSGTVGIEMSLDNIPVITAGMARYKGLGFTFDAKDKKDYERLLFSDELKITDEMRKQLELFADFYFIKSTVDFPVFKTLLSYPIELTIDNLNVFNPGENRDIDHICDFLMGKKEIIQYRDY